MGEMVTSALDSAVVAELEAAFAALKQGGGPVVRAADVLGKLLGRAGDGVLRRVGLSVNHPALTELASVALGRAYDIAILGMDGPGSPAGRSPAPAPALALVALSGFVGGFAGLAGFVPDATLTTLMILREVARIARAQGEDLSTESARAACVQVFGLKAGDEAGYFSARLMLQGNAARALLGQVATRWGPVLGEKLAAGAVPVAGAVAASVLNAAFLSHYRQLATAHFTIRRLERTYGREVVRAAAGVAANPAEDELFMES
jgi:hypothetical protein